MAKLILAGAILFILIVGGIVALYFFYEKPVQKANEVQYHNLSIRAFDAATQKAIAADYLVVSNKQEYRGTTNPSSFVLQQIPTNHSLKVFVSEKDYYTHVRSPSFSFEIPTNLRIDVTLDKIGTVHLGQRGALGFDNPVALTLNVSGIVTNALVCVRWTNNLISVSARNLSIHEKPNRLQTKVDKCYLLNDSLSGTSEILLDYKEYLPVAPHDEIRVTFVYGDISAPDGAYVFERDGKAVNKEDITFGLL